MTASERIRAARLQKDKALVSALDQNPVETRKSKCPQFNGYSVKVKS